MTHLIHHYHHSLHLHILNSRTSRAVAAMTMRTFSAGLISLYLPLFLLNSGYSLAQVCIFFIVAYTLKACGHSLVKHYINRYGVSHMLLISFLFAAIFALSLTMIEGSLFWLGISVITLMLSQNTYWDARHIDLAKLFDSQKMVKQTSLLFILNSLVAAASPLIGGYISQFYGQAPTLLIAAASYFVGAAVLFRDWEEEANSELPKEEQLKKDKYLLKDAIANFAMNYQGMVYLFAFPLYLYYQDLDLSEVGMVISVGLFVGMILNGYFASHNLNHISKFILTGLIIGSLFHLAVPFAIETSVLVFITVVREIGTTLYSSPYTTLFYRNARNYGATSYVTFIESIGDVAKVLTWLPILAFSSTSPVTGLTISFFIAAAIMPFSYLMTNRNDTSSV